MAKQPQDETSEKQTANRESQFGVREGQFGSREQNREQTGREQTGREQTGREQAGRNGQYGREAQAAGQQAQSSMRHAQQAVAELTASAMLQPYAELMQEMDSFNRDWAGRLRSSIDRTLDLTLKLQETWISQAKRTTDLYLRMYESDLSAQTAMTRDLQERTSSAVQRYGSQAAE